MIVGCCGKAPAEKQGFFIDVTVRTPTVKLLNFSILLK